MASGLEENLLRLDQGRKHDARDMLALVYDRFTEGLEMHDLRMAKNSHRQAGLNSTSVKAVEARLGLGALISR